MDDQFLTPDEKELLSLVRYFKKKAAEKINNHQTISGPEQQFMDSIDDITERIQNAADRRQQDKAAQKAKALQEKVVECPRCKTSKSRQPSRTKKNDKGYLCNQYYCNNCKIIFTDYLPNNTKDRLKWMENFLYQLNKKRDGKTGAETFDIPRQEIDVLQHDYHQLKKEYEEEQKLLQTITEHEKKYLTSTAHLRDALLLIKLKGLSWGPIAES